MLAAAGFDVRVPLAGHDEAVARACGSTPIRRRRRRSSAPTSCRVRWSVVVDDVELDAADINRLAAQARPLVRSRGHWVELDHADLERRPRPSPSGPTTTQLTGADILRHALGLEGRRSPAGAQSGQRLGRRPRCARAPGRSSTSRRRPEGFEGELRSYQAEALGWLGFLDGAGLGGCLALDMGLGKTPTVLAHLAGTRGNGPSLVVAPPAVRRQLGRRGRALHARPAGRRAPRRRPRASAGSWPARSAEADVVLTTYGTAVRDIEALAEVEWARLVARRGPGHQEPGQRHRPAAAPHPGPQPHRPHRHADRERPRRPLGDPRLHQPGPGRPRPAFVAQLVRRPPRRRRAPAGGPVRAGAAGAQRPARVPPHQGRAGRSPPSCRTRSTSSTTAP